MLKGILPQNIKNKIWYLIDSSKICFNQYIIPDVDVDNFINNLSFFPKIAFVKQEIATDLYCCSKNTSCKEMIFSSFHRSGPVGLFTKLKADFYIIKLEDDMECNIWKLRTKDCGGPSLEIFEEYQNGIIRKKNGDVVNKIPQSHYAIKSAEIDWGVYNIVISIDISVPARITKKHPNVKWCYIISEPCLRYYHLSTKKQINGYNFFLNQRFRTIKLNPKPKYHEIDFPYHFHYYGCFHDLLNIPTNYYQPEGIFIENRTSSALDQTEYKKLEKLGTIRYPEEELLEKVIHKELKSKYFLSLTKGIIRSRIWGNAIIEAIACGCLVFGNHAEYTNKDLFTPFTNIQSVEEFVAKVNYLEKNPLKYKKEVNRQRRLLNYLCFIRPIKEILTKSIK